MVLADDQLIGCCIQSRGNVSKCGKPFFQQRSLIKTPSTFERNAADMGSLVTARRQPL